MFREREKNPVSSNKNSSVIDIDNNESESAASFHIRDGKNAASSSFLIDDILFQKPKVRLYAYNFTISSFK